MENFENQKFCQSCAMPMTFKIISLCLNKKGTFKAVVTFKGNKYYKKVTKKVKIKIK